MKIYTITAVLCMATTALANQGSSSNIEQGQNLARRAAHPQGVQQQEYELHRSHSEHGLEAHKDGNKHSSEHDDDDDDEEDDKESKSKSDDDDEKKDNKGKNGGKKGDDKKAGGSEGGEGKKNQNGGEGKKTGEGKQDDGAKGEDKKNGGQGKGTDGKGPAGTDPKQGGHQGAAPANGKAPGAGTPAHPAHGNAPVAGAPANPANGKAPVTGTPASPAADSSIPHDYASPLWLVQPFGASIWAQGTTYVISWGPNPDPIYAKKLADKTPVDIHLMQGPPAQLKEVTILKKDADSSLNSFTWTVPTTVPPAKDYSIRLKHEGQLDTYSHYFEVVVAGDPRSSKSNVGEPLEMPKMGDVPQPLDKSVKPNTPPNPPPANKPAAVAPPAAAKPAAHASAAVVGSQSANMLAFAMTLFGAVYLL
ncbi:hypothetical protein BGZ82_005203 [Podila clonocystis]|nr:hypothetical protein BGZ82_005203 [Podila clonocystis]